MGNYQRLLYIPKNEDPDDPISELGQDSDNDEKEYIPC